MNLLSKIKPWYWLLAALGLWLMIWAGYDANFWQVFTPGFPHSLLDAAQGLRTFLPLVAALLAVVFLILKKHILPKGFFLKPLGLLLIYSLVGVVSSAFSNDPMWALYWAAMYGSVVLVLLMISYSQDTLKKVAVAISLNWAIAGFLSVALTAFFLIQPGVLHSLTLNFLFCMGRPYEGFGGIPAAVQTLGIAGTRPTGLGRYAAIIALVAFCRFLYAEKKSLKAAWLVAFILAIAILLFAKGKTEIAVFIPVFIVVLVMTKKLKTWWILFIAIFTIVSGIIIFYNIPCTNSTALLNAFIPKTNPTTSNVVSTPPANGQTPKSISGSISSHGAKNSASNAPTTRASASSVVTQTKSLKALVTLSGRTNGVWSGAWQLFLTSPFLGRGFQADRIFLDGQNAQNTVLHTLIQTGIIGTIPFVLAFIMTFYMLWHLLKDPNLQGSQRIFLIEITAVFLFLVARGITESLAYYSADWIFIAPLIAYIQIVYENYHHQRIL